MGPNSNISVFLSLHGQRKFAKEVSASADELEAMGLKGSRAMGAFARKAESLKSFGKSWTTHVSLPVAAFAGVATGMAVNFKRQMGLIATDAGGTAKEVVGLEKAVLGLAGESQYGPQELAEALFHVESSGYRGAKAMKVLRESVKLATAGNSELESTTYGLVSAQKALYGHGSVKDVKKTAAEINAIVSHGDIRLEELVAGMGSGLIEKAVEAGVSLRSVGSALDVMTARGIPAQRASYALGFIFSKLVPTTEPAIEAFDELGISQESLLKKAQSPGGWPAMISFLGSKLKGLSDGAKQADISHIFGGGRMDVAVLASLQNIGDLNKNYKELNPNIALYNKHTKEASENPLIQLKKDWAAIQKSLVEIGDELIPLVVPAVHKLAEFGQTAANVFLKIPGPVKAIGVAALVAIGPLSSMLGYLASGTGRFLILANGLAKMGTRYNASRSEGSGFSSSVGSAFGGSGAAGALSAARGFATVIGPAVAAAGIGKIVISATEGDWWEAGSEGGGALIGGLAAVLTGNPELAPLAAGLGSFGGGLLYGLFSGSSQASVMHRELGHLSKATTEYKTALQALPGAGKEATLAARRHAKAVGVEHKAEHSLAAVLARFGPETLPATKAQLKLDRAQVAVVRSARAEKNAHRLAGNALKLFRMQSLHQVASIKQLLPLEAKRIRHLNEQIDREPRNLALVKQTVNVEKMHARHLRELTEAYAESEEKGGKPWSERLEKLSTLQAKYGAKGKALVRRLQEQRDSFRELREEGTAGALMYKELAQEIRGTARQLGAFQGAIEGLGPERLHPTGAEGKHHPLPQRHHTGQRGAGNAQDAAIRFPSRGGAPGALHGAIHIHNHTTVQSVLDGKVIAESTVKASRRAALLAQ